MQQAILVALGNSSLCRIWRQNAGTFRSMDGSRVVQAAPPGAADLTGILADGRRLELEVKAGEGRQSAQQRRWQHMIESHGGVYAIVRSVQDALDVVRRALP